MAAADALYPNLERYLAKICAPDEAADPRRLEFWLLCLGLLASVPVLYAAGWTWWLLALAVLGVLAACRALLRINARLRWRTRGRAERSHLPHRVNALVRTGRLHDVIGETGAAALERCATIAIQARATLERTYSEGVGGVLPEFHDRFSLGIAKTMEHAFEGFEQRLLFPAASPPTDLLMVVEAERELELLASAVSSWSCSILDPITHPDTERANEHFNWIPATGFPSAERE